MSEQEEPTTDEKPLPELLDVEEMLESLDGFDEIRIEKYYGCDPTGLADKPFKAMRALAFIAFRRNGMADVDAYARVMRLTMKQVMALYETEDAAAADPDAAAEGKGDGSVGAGLPVIEPDPGRTWSSPPA